MRIYTRRGDAGQTDLIGGTRVGKDHPRVVAFGCVDELNAWLGLVLAGCQEDAIKSPLITVQHRLFDIGAALADAGPAKPTTTGHAAGGRVIGLTATIAAMEAAMDRTDAELPPLTAFILPGGGEIAARLHVARTVCRRAERRVVELAASEPVDPEIVTFLNRLSDLLFVLARLANHRTGGGDTPWVPAEKSDKP